MMNLIGLKFTDKGSISVSIKWLDGKGVNDNHFEPLSYDSEGEGLFEKEEGLYLLSVGHQKQESKEHVLLTKKNKEFKEFVHNCEEFTPEVLKIIISDTGCGISQKGLGELFQKFSQVSDDPCKRQIGTGLGYHKRNMSGHERGCSCLQ